MKLVFFMFALMTSAATFATPVEYEYKVVMIEKTSRTEKIEGVKGAWLIQNKTKAFQDLMAQGWDIISIVPGAMDTDRVYIKRPLK